MFCLDIETLSTSSSTVILSAGLVYFDQTQTYTFEELIEMYFSFLSIKSLDELIGRLKNNS